MPPHLKRRGSVWYLIDGSKTPKSLKTTKKGVAEYQLSQYVKGRYGMEPTPTVGQYYQRWIETKREPLVRASKARDYRQHFRAHILKSFNSVMLSGVSILRLRDFQQTLVISGLSVKTVRNIIDSSFRAMWRDAMIEGIVEKNPFALLQWPRQPRSRPDPFTSEERERILGWWAENDFFFYPWVYFQFHTGCRPSETAALLQSDVDFEAGTISISKSRNMGTDAATKTANSERVIPVDERVVDLLKLLPSRALGLKYLFVNKRGNPMSKKWAEHNWAEPLRKLGIRHRKFYATRHTFITEMVKAGENLKVIADYCGTSVAMIEQDYCARQGFNLDRTVFEQLAKKPFKNVVAGPGFEPGTSRL